MQKDPRQAHTFTWFKITLDTAPHLMSPERPPKKNLVLQDVMEGWCELDPTLIGAPINLQQMQAIERAECKCADALVIESGPVFHDGEEARFWAGTGEGQDWQIGAIKTFLFAHWRIELQPIGN